jgi:hypothetical protein
MYSIFESISGITFIIRNLDGATIPLDESNTDYKEYLAWVAQGNTAEEFNNGL